MQCRAIFEALIELKQKNIKSAFPEIMIPLVSTEAEIKIMKDLVITTARKVQNDYIDNKIFSIDPFVSIDDGVKDLVKIAVEKGKKQNKKIKLGICGEHGGDPKSINFCSKVGLNYVSCSPYRVPIARLAAAQAELKKNKN